MHERPVNSLFQFETFSIRQDCYFVSNPTSKLAAPSRRSEAIPNVPLRFNEVIRYIIDLAAQPPDMDVDCAGSTKVVVLPNTSQQRFAAEYTTGIQR